MEYIITEVRLISEGNDITSVEVKTPALSEPGKIETYMVDQKPKKRKELKTMKYFEQDFFKAMNEIFKYEHQPRYFDIINNRLS